MRVTENELAEAASDLRLLTGDNYKIILAHQTAKLVKVRPGKTTHDTVYHEDTNGKLLDKINTFHAGIEEGIRLAAKRALPAPADPDKPREKIEPGLRAFAGTFLVCIDDTEHPNDGEEGHAPLTRDKLAEYLKDAVGVSLNDEEHGSVGVMSVEVHADTIRELTEDETRLYYGELVK
jgi:hypothetical protein